MQEEKTGTFIKLSKEIKVIDVIKKGNKKVIFKVKEAEFQKRETINLCFFSVKTLLLFIWKITIIFKLFCYFVNS